MVSALSVQELSVGSVYDAPRAPLLIQNKAFAALNCIGGLRCMLQSPVGILRMVRGGDPTNVVVRTGE
jgi:hypothetical protein